MKITILIEKCGKTYIELSLTSKEKFKAEITDHSHYSKDSYYVKISE